MKVTLLGHATILVELDGATVLMDPVFQDPFEDGAVVACPAREVFPERLPKLDKIIISHAHLDHFDIPSLARLPRDCEVLCPEDSIIPYVLAKLGFLHVQTLAAGALVELGHDCRLLTTFSDIDVIEFGVVFKDRSGIFWNEVDTVVNDATIDSTRARMGAVDLLFSVYACQNLGFFGSMRAGYPLGISRKNLANVRRIAPKLVVPGSAGFRFTGLLEWTNPFLFPISRDHFMEDLARVAPEIRSSRGNPGDVFEIDRGAVERHPGASNLARMIEDDTYRLDFDATGPVPPLTDPNAQGYPDAVMERQVTDSFDGLERFVRAAYANQPSNELVEEYRRTAFSYGLGVVFPDGHERWLHLHFDRDEPRIVRATGPLRGAIASHRIAASMLTARARYERSYVYYRGFSRLTQTYNGTEVGAGGIVRESKEPADLLGYYLSNEAPGADRSAQRRMDFQLETFLRSSTSPVGGP